MTTPPPWDDLLPRDFHEAFRPDGWTREQEAQVLTTVPGRPPAALSVEQATRLVWLLRQMDLQQNVTDLAGQREVAWYYWRDQVEEFLGLDPGALNMVRPAARFVTGQE